MSSGSMAASMNEESEKAHGRCYFGFSAMAFA